MEALITKNQKRIEMRANTSHPEVFHSNTVSHAEKSVFILTENRPLSRECLYICKSLRSWQSILQFFFICFFYSQGWTDFTQDRTARHKQAGLGLRGIHMQFRLDAFLRTKGVTMWRAIELKSGRGYFFFLTVKLVIDSRESPSLSVSLWLECITWTSGLASTNGQEAFVSHGQRGCADIEATEGSPGIVYFFSFFPIMLDIKTRALCTPGVCSISGLHPQAWHNA